MPKQRAPGSPVTHAAPELGVDQETLGGVLDERRALADHDLAR